MLTHFEKPEDSKELYFKLSNSLQITNFNDKSKASKFAGLYAIYKSGNCMYVGQSQNIASRISQHLSGKYESADRVFLFLATSNGYGDFFDRDVNSRKSILEANENLLISKLKPIENLMLPDQDYKITDDRRFHFYEEIDESEVDIKDIACASLYVSKYLITLSSTNDSLVLEGCEFLKDYNEYIAHAYSHFGDEEFKRSFGNG